MSDDIFREVDEELRRDKLEKLWRSHGWIVVVVVVAIIAGTAGWVAWQRWQESRRIALTTELVTTLERADAAIGSGAGDAAAKDAAKAVADALAAFAAKAGSGQSTIARFHEAGLRARQGDREAAIRLYDALAAGDGLPMYRDLATVLGVLHRMDGGDPAQLQGRLAPLTVDGNPWRFTARELTALLSVQGGDRARARDLFQKLADDPAAPSGVRGRAAELAALYGRT